MGNLIISATTISPSKKFINQDAILTTTRPRKLGYTCTLCIVADGMGSLSKAVGKSSSELAIKAIHENLNDLFEQDNSNFPSLTSVDSYLKHRILKAVETANTSIYTHWQQFEESVSGGSTVVCALVYDNLAFIANVGDSRAYLLRNNNLRQITKDHTLVNRLVELGELSLEEAKNHPQRNVLYNILGQSNKTQVDVVELILEDNDQLLLCSDGLNISLDDTEIKRHMLENVPVDEAVEKLKNTAKENAVDDISIIIIRVGDESKFQGAP